MRTLGSPDVVELRTVGIDVGSSTSQLVVSDVRLRRDGRSSRFVVVARTPVWVSPVTLTPYRDGDRIDERALLAFVDEQYAAGGIDPTQTDTGAVILTGTALLRRNARVAAELLSRHSGRLVCAAAGHDYEARLAAHGSGVVARSRDEEQRILHVDIGGGTTKLALVHRGRVVDTAAIPVGARLVSWDHDRRVVQIDREFARTHDRLASLRVGDVVSEHTASGLAAMLCEELTDAIASVVEGRPTPVALLAPESTPWKADLMTFSGGVAEYLDGTDAVDVGDLGASLGRQLRDWTWPEALPSPQLAHSGGIRATVLGAGQYSTRLSGSTIHVSDVECLPITGLPVVRVDADAHLRDGAVDVPGLAAAVVAAARRDPDRIGDRLPLLAICWSGGPRYAAVRGLAEAVDRAQRELATAAGPLVVALDADLGQTLGRVLVRELRAARSVVSLDSLDLGDLDYVDVGELIADAGAVPVVVTSLLFPPPTESGRSR
jgi:ethanolamine utilization protein EutA